MDTVSALFTMGGYAGYVWPSYALAVVVMAGLLVASIRSAHRHERDLDALQRLRPGRKRGRDQIPVSEAPHP
ncbi:heme exporter protein CcmD [Magnetospirillum sulfuroxidans]|uniref:Heme exporter protein D n=1 Tax=Magnetospirillum sulfuroxidans TaxID=611300 RepID=A0ABS5IDX5_9PROT|nr:heme exporter protein CcmD [Magnetospirillum sulfuroxidans]MBR9972629.1 heme exporter protein CcmD [Magnetospirillum sulfuroxidans]